MRLSASLVVLLLYSPIKPEMPSGIYLPIRTQRPDNSTASSTTASSAWNTQHRTWQRLSWRCGEKGLLLTGKSNTALRLQVLRHSWWRNVSGMARPGMVLAIGQTTGNYRASQRGMETPTSEVGSTRTRRSRPRNSFTANEFQERNFALNTPHRGTTRKRQKN